MTTAITTPRLEWRDSDTAGAFVAGCWTIVTYTLVPTVDLVVNDVVVIARGLASLDVAQSLAQQLQDVLDGATPIRPEPNFEKLKEILTDAPANTVAAALRESLDNPYAELALHMPEAVLQEVYLTIVDALIKHLTEPNGGGSQ